MALLTLDEAKAQLDIETTQNDVELQAYVDSLTTVIEGYIGPVENREVTETVTGCGPLLSLLQPPVVSLTSFTPILTGGTSLDVARLHVDGPSGTVRRLDGGRFVGGPWTAVYQAGRGSIAPTINLAARILLQHLWRTQNGGARGGARADDFDVTEPIVGFGYAVPNRVLQLLESFKQPPGIA